MASITDDDVLKEKKIKTEQDASLTKSLIASEKQSVRKAIENLSRAISPVGLCLFFLLPES
jgi:hypothetical protein